MLVHTTFEVVCLIGLDTVRSALVFLSPFLAVVALAVVAVLTGSAITASGTFDMVVCHGRGPLLVRPHCLSTNPKGWLLVG